jgi:hypothetical protein
LSFCDAAFTITLVVVGGQHSHRKMGHQQRSNHDVLEHLYIRHASSMWQAVVANRKQDWHAVEGGGTRVDPSATDATERPDNCCLLVLIPNPPSLMCAVMDKEERRVSSLEKRVVATKALCLWL